jgi:hypothetical protein
MQIVQETLARHAEALTDAVLELVSGRRATTAPVVLNVFGGAF